MNHSLVFLNSDPDGWYFTISINNKWRRLQSVLGQSRNYLEQHNAILAKNYDADKEHGGDEKIDHTFRYLQFVTHSVKLDSETLK